MHRDHHAAAAAAVIVAAVLGVVAAAASCTAFTAGDPPPVVFTPTDAEPVSDAEDPILTPEPVKGATGSGILDAAIYDGPVLEGGSVIDSARCSSDRGPAMVELQVGSANYCIDTTEVTVAQYDVFLNALQAGTSPDKPPYCAYNTNYAPNCGGGNTKQPEEPVNCIDWCDAWAFCKWAGKRLCGRVTTGGANAQSDQNDPTKSQWFAACTRGGARTFAYGDLALPGACNAKPNGPAKVRSHPGCEGGYDGLFDLTGNVGEWEDSCSGTTGQDDKCLRRGGDIVDEFNAQNCAQSFAIERKARFAAGGFRCCKD